MDEEFEPILSNLHCRILLVGDKDAKLSTTNSCTISNKQG